MNDKVNEKKQSPQKKRGGKKKGSNSFVRVRFSDLKGYISEQIPMTVSRVWLESLGFCIQPTEFNNLTPCEEIGLQPCNEDSKEEDKVDFKILNTEEGH